MQDYDVQKHQGYLTYGAATPAAGNRRWHAEGIVFSKDFPKRVEEIHYMKSELDFPTEKKARDHAIALCKIWIDRGNREKTSSPS